MKWEASIILFSCLLNKLSCVPQSYLLRISTVHPPNTPYRHSPHKRSYAAGSTVFETSSPRLQQRQTFIFKQLHRLYDWSLSHDAKCLLIQLKMHWKDLCSPRFNVSQSQLSDLFGCDSEMKCQSIHRHSKQKKVFQEIFFFCVLIQLIEAGSRWQCLFIQRYSIVLLCLKQWFVLSFDFVIQWLLFFLFFCRWNLCTSCQLSRLWKAPCAYCLKKAPIKTIISYC